MDKLVHCQSIHPGNIIFFVGFLSLRALRLEAFEGQELDLLRVCGESARVFIQVGTVPVCVQCNALIWTFSPSRR